MKTSVEKLLDEQLNGLLLPPDNTLFSWEAGLGLIILSLCVLSVTLFYMRRYRHYHQQPAVAATRQLKALQNSSPRDKQSTAIAITQILQRGLNVNRLDQYQSDAHVERSAWEAFTTQLNKVCYSANNTEKISINQLINESHDWLSKAVNEQSEANHV